MASDTEQDLAIADLQRKVELLLEAVKGWEIIIKNMISQRQLSALNLQHQADKESMETKIVTLENEIKQLQLALTTLSRRI